MQVLYTYLTRLISPLRFLAEAGVAYFHSRRKVSAEIVPETTQSRNSSPEVLQDSFCVSR
jgi:hypothetical protein